MTAFQDRGEMASDIQSNLVTNKTSPGSIKRDDFVDFFDKLAGSLFDEIEGNANVGQVNAVQDLFDLGLKDVASRKISTSRYYPAGTFGGGEYRYDPDAVEVPNGGSILPGIGGSISWDIDGNFTGTSGSGRFFLIDKGVQDPYQWGAIGDGVTNTRPQFDNFFNSIPSGSHVVIPGGTFRFDDDSGGLAYVEIADLNSVTIDANSSVFELADETGYCMFRFVSTIDAANPDQLDSFKWTGGKFNGRRSSQNYTDAIVGVVGNGNWEADAGNSGLLRVSNYKTAVVENVQLEEFVTDGIVFVRNRSGKIVNCDAINQASPIPDAFPQAFKFRPSQDGLEAKFLNCTARNCNIGFSSQDSQRYDSKLSIIGCDAYESYQSAIYNEGVKTVVIVGGEFLNTFGPFHQLVKVLNESVQISNAKFSGGKIESGAYKSVDSEATISNCIIKNNLNNEANGAGEKGPAIQGFDLVSSCRIDGGGIADYAVQARQVINSIIDVSGTNQGGIEGVSKIENCEIKGDSREGYGVDAAAGFQADNLTISGFERGIQCDINGRFQVINSRIFNIDECCVFCDANNTGSMQVMNCVFEDYGIDLAVDVSLRYGISGKDADCVLVSIGNVFRDSYGPTIWGTVASPVDVANSIGNIELDMEVGNDINANSIGSL